MLKQKSLVKFSNPVSPAYIGYRVEAPNTLCREEVLVKSKGVYYEEESERSWRQIFGSVNRNNKRGDVGEVATETKARKLSGISWHK